ncbi:FAS-associated death domain protein-like isoform X2 [Gigantopelta aegis]|uniref:FAS-associated death domain protein-like isoform X2 n=1 Tax=Gigantopelta aegis TaxID=1735272 RepID=UPI001B88E2FB|nr:FAS-associated death domain protein-like isoform X2 [Gigantopelta aegis]
MNKDLKFRTVLTDLGDMLAPSELEKMKYYCKNHLKAIDRDKIDTAIMLWSKLEERKLIGPDNLGFLKQMLKTCTSGRQDVLDVLMKYAPGEDVEMIDARPENVQQRREYRGPDLTREVKFLTNHLAKDWRFFVRSLGVQEDDIDMVVENYPRNVREQINQAIWIWLYKEQENARKQHFTNALLDVRRRDLAHKLNTNDY